METRVLELNTYKEKGVISAEDEVLIKEAADAIRNGGLVAFPTETVYGLGGNALSPEASRLIYAAKGRPSDNPLIVHICDISMLEGLVSDVSREAGLLMEAYWPGPMTLIFRKRPVVPAETTGGLGTVAIRYPSHPVALRLIEEAGIPIAAPSANRSGRPSTTTARHCIEDLDGRVDVILDGGSCEIGVESTIIDVTGGQPVLLRPGAVTEEMIEAVLGISAVAEDAAIKGPLADGVRPKAPGMKYRHYAPKAPMVLVCAGSRDRVPSIAPRMAGLVRDNCVKYNHISVLCSGECCEELRRLEGMGNICIRVTGSRYRQSEVAHDIFERLREFDEDGTDFIIAEGYLEKELGMAVMNRLKKAAAWQVVYV